MLCLKGTLLRSTVWRYVLLQVPGWVLIAAAGAALWSLGLVPGWLCLTAAAVWVIKDIALYPVVRRAFEASEDSAARVVGQTAVVVDELSPLGYVRLGSELWKAELTGAGADTFARPGERVIVVRANGLTLLVRGP
jgi:membrane protein implicated in regulation of membrane protease activity